MASLDGQRAVVFGASSGVGLAAAKALAARGAKVVITGRDEARLKEAAAACGPATEVARVDGRDVDAIRAFFAGLGPIDHLVIPAGETDRGGTFGKELTLEKLRATFEGKFWVQVAVAHAGVSQLRSGGSLTFISGGAAHRALPGMVNVAAVNGAIEAIIGPLTRDLAPTRVNAISPGTLNTGYWRGTPDDTLKAIFDRTAKALPAGRVGEAEDIAQAVVFVVENTFVAGTVIQVDGGIQHSSL